MGKYSEFLSPKVDSKDEKIIGFYGCGRCSEYSDFAYWNEYERLMFWVCSNGHRTEKQID